MRRLLMVSHRGERCGVQQFGWRLFEVLCLSDHFYCGYAECDGVDELLAHTKALKPDAVVLNYHPVTLPWALDIRIRECGVPCFVIVHEVYQATTNQLKSDIFDFFLCPDPTLLPHNPVAFSVPRFIPAPRPAPEWAPDVFTVGSFGFATGGKGFERLCQIVNSEFEQARIRLNVPPHDNDSLVPRARLPQLQASCAAQLTKPGISLEITEYFFDEHELLNFLAENTINAFLYDDSPRGISSCTDYALACGRPVAVSGSAMFRNLHGVNPSISVEDRRLREIAATGIAPLRHHIQQYAPKAASKAWSDTILAALALRETCRAVPDGRGFNKILDDRSRNTYTKALQDLHLAPELLARKIPLANIQQAFALDTFERLVSGFVEPRILAVGSFEDTTVAVLREKGFRIADVDPNVNQMDLDAFAASPAAVAQSYDIVLCVSVLEHVLDDERFVRTVGDLLAADGIAIFTVDFSNRYPEMMRKPSLDERLYTTQDLLTRLMAILPDCALLDVPHWDDGQDEFTYDDCHYSFASWVFRKFNAQTLRHAIPYLTAQRNLPQTILNTLAKHGKLYSTMHTMIGHEEVEAGSRVFSCDGSKLGFLAFGPYCACAEGSYEVRFLIKTETVNLSAETAVAALDVVFDGVPQDPQRSFNYGDLQKGAFSMITLRFFVPNNVSQLETRLLLVYPLAMMVVASVAITKISALTPCGT